MINKIGFNCITPIKRPLSQDSNTTKAEIDAPILRKCVNPTVFLSIIDVDGNILDKQTFSIQTTTRPETEKNPVTTIIIIVLIVVLAILFYLKKKGKIFNKKLGNISTGVTMLFLIIMFGLMPFARVGATAIYLELAEDDGSGGAYVDPGDTGTVPAGLGATVNLDKSVYSQGEAITVTTSIYYNSCTNAVRDVVATGYISGTSYTGPTKTLFDSTISGTESQVFDTAIFTAPNTPGNYILNIEIKGYIPASYEFHDSALSVTMTYSDLETLRESLLDHVGYNYNENDNYISVMDSLNSAYTISAMQSAVDPLYTISVWGGDRSLDFVRNYDLPFVVQASPTVELRVNDSTADPQTITSGDPVQVSWIAQNATGGCTCSTNTLVKLNDDPLVVPSNYCGNSIGALGETRSTSFDIYGVTSQTIFTVSCNND